MRYLIGRWLVTFFILLPMVVHAQPARLIGVSSSNSKASSRIIFSLSQYTPYHIFALENPRRLVVDFENTKLLLKLNSVLVRGVEGVRIGRPAPTRLRLVFDLNSSIRYTEFYDKTNNQLKLDVYLTSQSSASRVEKSPIIQTAERSKTIVIVIDPGHGGKDSGAIGDRGTKEKDVVLAISKKLADLINQHPGMRAELTRRGDYFIPLRERLKLARKGKADLFIAVHADAFFNNNATGASVYALSKHGATSEAARWLSKRDNYSELSGVDLDELGDQSYMLRSVLIDLAQTATITDSLRLGTSILDSLDNVTRLHYPRVEQAPFVVLKSPDIPSVLVETGFISNFREEMRLGDGGYQNQLAQALFSGIRLYLRKNPPGI